MWSLEYQVQGADYELFCAQLSEIVTWGWEEEGQGAAVRFRITVADPSQAPVIKARLASQWPDLCPKEQTLPSRDWAEAWKAFFTPVEIGSDFLILPSWELGGFDLSGLDKSGSGSRGSGPCRIFISPKMAFGTGHHATTALCLKLLARLRSKGALAKEHFFLDLGTGSGILSIACARLGLCGLALDIDPVAVENCMENLALNQVQGQVRVVCSSLEAVQARERFSLALANILAAPLQAMAPLLKERLRAGSFLILSGILNEQAEGVRRSYLEQGFVEQGREQQGEWTGLLLQKPGC